MILITQKVLKTFSCVFSPDFPTPPRPSIAIRMSTGCGSFLSGVAVGVVEPLRVLRPFGVGVEGDESESLVSLLRAPWDEYCGDISRPVLVRLRMAITGVEGRIIESVEDNKR